jgi:hypothetical protein
MGWEWRATERVTVRVVPEMSERGRSAGRAGTDKTDGERKGYTGRGVSTEGRTEDNAGSDRQGDDRATHRLAECAIRATTVMPAAQLVDARVIGRRNGCVTRGCGSRMGAGELQMPVREPGRPEQRELGQDEPQRQPAATGNVPWAARMVHDVSPPLAPIIQTGTGKCNPRLPSVFRSQLASSCRDIHPKSSGEVDRK